MRTQVSSQLSRFALLAVTALVAACESSPTDLADGRTIILVVQPSSATLRSGGRLQLNVTAQGAVDRTLTAADMLWSSTDNAVASVTPDGVVTAKGNGAAQISAWYQGHQALATVKVVERGNFTPCDNLAFAGSSRDKKSSCAAPEPETGGKR